MAKIKAPKAKNKYEITIDNFKGIDLRNSPSKMSINRSPMCPNLIRETVGNNRKRRGYETLLSLEGPINGIHKITGKNKALIIHGGQNYYKINTENWTTEIIYNSGNNHKSISNQIDGKIYILDGLNYLICDGNTIKDVSEEAYVPTIIIARKYDGGGVPLEPINLINSKRIEKFTGDSSHKTFQLTSVEIDDTEVQIQSLEDDGNLIDLKENIDFTVNRELGTFILNTVKETPIIGEDNLYVKYSKSIEGYKEKIKNCDIQVIYGINGARDRIFVSGNENYPHYDWYSKANDPTYFGDTWYSVIGQDNAAIVGYSIINDSLITHKNEEDNEFNANIRKGTLEDNKVIFKSSGSLKVAGAIGKKTFGFAEGEPLYLSSDYQICAITPSDVLGERASQERSFFISSELRKEENIAESYAITYKGFYMLAIGERMYILDSTQSVYSKMTPYSNRQYECYLWTDINAKILAVYNDRLIFGTGDGKVKRFFNSDVAGYKDDGIIEEKVVEVDGEKIKTKESYECYWDTGEIYGTREELKKTFKHLAVLLASYPTTGCRVWAKVEGIWEMIFDYDEAANFIDFSNIDFERFTFRTDDTPALCGGKFKVKNVLHIQLRFENSRPEPFGIYFAKLKYTLGNEYIK
ncbi:MAG: hypothetical protein WCR27_05365 [Eubacteriales bacterium]